MSLLLITSPLLRILYNTITTVYHVPGTAQCTHFNILEFNCGPENFSWLASVGNENGLNGHHESFYYYYYYNRYRPDGLCTVRLPQDYEQDANPSRIVYHHCARNNVVFGGFQTIAAFKVKIPVNTVFRY